MALPKRPPLKVSLSFNKVRDWTPSQVANWMEDINDGLFSQYIDTVISQKINGTNLMNLTEDEMKTKLGITMPNHITTLSASIGRLKNKLRGRKHSPVPRSSPSIKISLDDLLDIRVPTLTPLNDTHSDANHRLLQKTKSMATSPIRHHHSAYGNDDEKTKQKKNKKNYNLKRSKTEYTTNRKHTALTLKRQMTQKNENAQKQDKNLHKNMGKKMWPNETSRIIKEGWMKKRGVRRSGFKERWCVLRDNGHLYYFEKRPSVQSNDDLPQGVLDLDHVLKIEYVQDDDPNTFNCKTKDRDWIFSAMSGRELVQWMTILNKTVATIRL